jgi:FAD:protein FMN transferase
MGMPVTIDVRDRAGDAGTLELAFAEFRLLDRIFSPFRPDSEVSRINRGELKIEDASEEVSCAIGIGRLYTRATNGYFALWLNGRFDPSGLVKSWAIDRAASILELAGASSYLCRRRRRRIGSRRQWRWRAMARGHSPPD